MMDGPLKRRARRATTNRQAEALADAGDAKGARKMREPIVREGADRPLVALEVNSTRPKMTDKELALYALHSTLVSRETSARRDIESELTMLRQNIDRAFRALADGARIDAHLIHNASMLTASIERWNITREVLPLSVEAGGKTWGETK